MYSISLGLIGILVTFCGSMCPLFPKISELAKALSGWGGGGVEEQALLDAKYKKWVHTLGIAM